MSGIRRVAIIGAGNAGLTAAKYLLAEKRFSEIHVFEQRDCVGGLWKYAPDNDREASFAVPQTSADAPYEEPIWRRPDKLDLSDPSHANGPVSDSTGKPTFVSPMYERLEANLPKMIMQHSDMPFPDSTQLFATHQQTLDYLEQYGNEVKDLVQFRTQVRRLEPLLSTDVTRWNLTTRQLGIADDITAVYDAVVVASGHFNVPFIPDIPGVEEWNERHPDSITHSKFFRKPETYSGKKTLTIGRGSSGLDIASQIALYCRQPLVISTRDSAALVLPNDAPYAQRPNIRSLDPKSRSVTFVDGHVEHAIDRILFCTGYLYSYPFFPPGTLDKHFPDAPLVSKDDRPHGVRPHELYKYIFYAPAPSLAFLSIPQQIVPFPVVDSQAAAVARAWAGRLALPDRLAMKAWDMETAATMGEDKKWLWLKPPLDGQYLNGLADWVDGAQLGMSVPGYLPLSADERVKSTRKTAMAPNGHDQVEIELSMAVRGKLPARWGEKEFWMRQRIFQIKHAFIAKGQERRNITTLEQLGFDFEEWKRKERQDPSHGGT